MHIIYHIHQLSMQWNWQWRWWPLLYFEGFVFDFFVNKFSSSANLLQVMWCIWPLGAMDIHSFKSNICTRISLQLFNVLSLLLQINILMTWEQSKYRNWFFTKYWNRFQNSFPYQWRSFMTQELSQKGGVFISFLLGHPSSSSPSSLWASSMS